MTRLVDQAHHIAVMQHHDRLYSLGSRSAQWHARVSGDGSFGEQVFDRVGDRVCMRFWPANTGSGSLGPVVTGRQTAGLGGTRELNAWAPIYPSVTVGPSGPPQDIGDGLQNSGGGAAGGKGAKGIPGQKGPGGGGGGAGGGGGTTPAGVDPALYQQGGAGLGNGPRFGPLGRGGQPTDLVTRSGAVYDPNRNVYVGARTPTGQGPISATGSYVARSAAFANSLFGRRNSFSTWRPTPNATTRYRNASKYSLNPKERAAALAAEKNGKKVKWSEQANNGKGGVVKENQGAAGGKGAKGASGVPGPYDGSVEGKSGPPRFIGQYPVIDSSWSADGRFKLASTPIPAEDSNIPAGMQGVSMAGTDERSQQDVFLPVTRRVIVPGYEGSPDMATLFCDLEPENEIAKGVPPGIGGRQAWPQTMMRVVKMPTALKGIPAGEGNGLAWNLRDSEQGGMSGFGLVWGRVQGGSPSQPSQPITPRPNTDAKKNPVTHSANSPAAPILGGPQRGRTSSPAQNLPAWQVWYNNWRQVVAYQAANNPAQGGGIGGSANGGAAAKNPGKNAGAGSGDGRTAPGNANAAALMSSDAGGPLSVGYAEDKHRVGTTKDDEPVNSGALATSAIWDRNENEKAPKEFNGPYPGGKVWDTPLHVFMGYDAGSKHSGPYGTKEGLFRRYAFIPFDEDPGREPNDAVPPPPTGEPNDPIPPPPTREPSDVITPKGVLPGQRNARNRGLVAGAGGAFGGSGVVAQSAPMVGKDSHIIWQRAVGFGSMLWRPQTTYGGSTDFRWVNGIDPAKRQDDLRSRPASVRMEAYAKESGGAWDYLRRNSYSRVPGGEASTGGIAFMPPAFDIVDYRDGEPPASVTSGTSYVTLADSVNLAFGLPSPSRGSVQDGGFRFFRESSGVKLQTISSGTWGAFTPTNDDHVATKKYVDDNASSGAATGGWYGRVAPDVGTDDGGTYSQAMGTTPAIGTSPATPYILVQGVSNQVITTCGVYYLTVPPGYDPTTQSLTVNVVNNVTNPSQVSDKVDVLVYKNGAGSDLCTTAQQTLSTGVNEDNFNVTDTGFTGGVGLSVYVVYEQDDTGGPGGDELAHIAVALTVT